MITTTSSVARWSWGEFGKHPDPVHEAVRLFHLTLGVLERHQLGVPQGGRVAVHVSKWGGRDDLLRADLPVGVAGDGALVEGIRRGLDDGKMGGVGLYATCDGVVETAAGPEPVEGMFAVSVDVDDGFSVVWLITFSDAWMPFDLRGRAQEALFAANRPRLAAALAGLSQAFGMETDPDDPTWFGIATTTGVENHYEHDGTTPSDVWGSFEIPYRNGIFSQTPRFTAGYGRQASGPVRYVPVMGSQGVLGYLWASDTEAAASFEPRDAADLDAYRAGLVWLDRLQEAYDKGLSPTAALVELGRCPADPVAGLAEVNATVEVDEFGKLALLALE
ncbi:hypothetical protein [Streptomyces sp. NBC_00091]|uniref:hypothetical protein n=1 Tax=Streptomyces sp. NBC_00091 TaxID=2975648 RepID=UPI00225482FC|nr:hypothetical protein [Streptomyces sp. NBC_00091]MCX5376726.1 hypothetical protein [Streptomyces sp. NBC_00091]